MAALTQTSLTGSGIKTGTANTLTASDTMVPAFGVGQVITFHNTTGATITPTITGSAAVSENVERGGSVNYAAGLAVAVPAGATRSVVVDNNKGFFAGNITITGGTNLLCWIDTLGA